MPFEVAKKFIDYMFEGREDPTSEFYEGNSRYLIKAKGRLNEINKSTKLMNI